MMRRAFTIAALLGCLMLMEAQPAADGAQMLVDLLAQWQSGQTDGLLSPTVVRTIHSGGVRKQGGFLHPTQKPARILFKLSLPTISQGEKLVLLAWAGLDDNIPEDDPAHPWDGVRARLAVNQQAIAEVDCAAKGWQPLSADISSFGGQTVNLEFVVEGKANTHYDWAYIAEPRLVRLRERFARKVARLLPPEGVLELESDESITLSLKPVYKQAVESPQPPIQLRVPARRTIWLEYGFQGCP
jgi:hypothetical protein